MLTSMTTSTILMVAVEENTALHIPSARVVVANVDSDGGSGLSPKARRHVLWRVRKSSYPFSIRSTHTRPAARLTEFFSRIPGRDIGAKFRNFINASLHRHYTQPQQAYLIRPLQASKGSMLSRSRLLRQNNRVLLLVLSDPEFHVVAAHSPPLSPS